MIYIQTVGRLGNQMFFYAFARAIQERNPGLGEIIFIYENAEYEKYGGLTILDFNVKIHDFAERPELTKKQRFVLRVFRKLESICTKKGWKKIKKILTISLQPILNINGLYVGLVSGDARIHHNSRTQNVYATGYWENPTYFNSIKDKIKKEFSPKYELLPHNADLLHEIMTTNSVCVSIRRGDFLARGNEKHNVCTEKYFYEAEKIIAGLFDAYKLFIFSDDVEWCRQNMHFEGQVVFENNNGDDPVWEKIRLMSACKHFIISNSSFSWWAQYLSNSPDKIVIAPRPWKKNDYRDYLYDESFILLNGADGTSAAK